MRRLALLLLATALVAAALLVGLAGAGAIGEQSAGGGGGDPSDEPDPDLVARGRALFRTGCASCHGADGDGTDIAPSLVGAGAAAADFQLTTGRMPDTDPDAEPESKPPAYEPDEIDALVAYVASLGPGPPIPDVEHPPGDLTEGGELFLLNCAACHSASANGGALSSGRNAPTLHGATSTQIGEAMRTGPGEMPRFGNDTLTDQQVNSIVTYVRYLRDPEHPGGLDLGNVGPITEGLVALLFGLVVLAFVCHWIEPKEPAS
jgi:ubiquinol-cytochrome c reductase cytochrome c subunit